MRSVSWASKDKAKAQRLAPNIVAMTRRFNRISGWVTTVIVFQDRLRVRVLLVEWFLRVLEVCVCVCVYVQPIRVAHSSTCLDASGYQLCRA